VLGRLSGFLDGEGGKAVTHVVRRQMALGEKAQDFESRTPALRNLALEGKPELKEIGGKAVVLRVLQLDPLPHPALDKGMHREDKKARIRALQGRQPEETAIEGGVVRASNHFI
jgi:hypothetical protein